MENISIDTTVTDNSKLTIYEYDTRIDDYNWYAIFFGSMLFYFMVQAVARVLAPSPGDIKGF